MSAGLWAALTNASWNMRLGLPAALSRIRSASIARFMDSISSGKPRSAAHPATLTSINLRSSKSWRIEVCAASPAKSAVVGEISSGSVMTAPRPCLVTSPRTVKDFKASRIVVRPTPNTEQRLRSEGSRSPRLQFTASDLLLKIGGDLVDTAVKLDHGQTKISLTPQIRLLYSKTRQLWPDQFTVISEEFANGF